MILLKDIIDQYMMRISVDPTHVNHGTSRTVVLERARMGLDELHYSTNPEYRTVRMELTDTMTLRLPPGTLEWIRISVVNPYNGQLSPLYHNPNLPINVGFQTDPNGALILGDDGYAIPVEQSEIETTSIQERFNDVDIYDRSFDYGGFFGIPGGVISNTGRYRYDSTLRQFFFADLPRDISLFFELIVQPELSGKSEAEIEIHEYMREPLMMFIDYWIASVRINVPEYVVRRFEKLYGREKRKLKKRLLFKPEEILQALNTARGFTNKF